MHGIRPHSHSIYNKKRGSFADTAQAGRTAPLILPGNPRKRGYVTIKSPFTPEWGRGEAPEKPVRESTFENVWTFNPAPCEALISDCKVIPYSRNRLFAIRRWNHSLAPIRSSMTAVRMDRTSAPQATAALFQKISFVTGSGYRRLKPVMTLITQA